jgi:hypothetical protein
LSFIYNFLSLIGAELLKVRMKKYQMIMLSDHFELPMIIKIHHSTLLINYEFYLR